MPQIKPEYEELDEFVTIANKLVKKYPDVFFGLDIAQVKCVSITNKNRGKKKHLWEVKSVPMPIRLDCPYRYYVILFRADWDEMEEKHKYLLVADALLTIPTEEDKETLNNFDLNDFDVMVRTFGVDYLQKDGVPDILKDEVVWRKASG